MDPRHPEQAISRMRELMKQYDRIESDMEKATTSSQIGQLEREGGLVVQEICLVAPRMHEAMMQTSRNRRYDLTHGILIEPQDTAVETPQGGMFEPEIVEEAEVVEERRSEALAEIAKQTERIGEQISEIADTVTEKVEKTAKKKPAKKKTTKKAKK